MFRSKKTLLLILLLSAFALQGCGSINWPFEIVGPGEKWDETNFRGIVSGSVRDVHEPVTGALIGRVLTIKMKSGAEKLVYCERWQKDCWSEALAPGFSQIDFKGEEDQGLLFAEQLEIKTKGSR